MKPLKRKLATTFTALGLLGLLVVGVTSYSLVQWRESEEEQARHYTRSLRHQEARALTFEAYKEVPDAVLGADGDFRDDYERRLAPIGAVFDEWASLAEDDAERQQVAAVRAAAEALDTSAQDVFRLVEAGDIEAAIAQIETVEETAFEPFDALTTEAVTSDRVKREEVQAAAREARNAANLALVVSGVGVVSLLLLVGAYLAGGLFAPIRALHRAMGELVEGRADTRLPEDGDDEIAELNQRYNRLADRLSAGLPTDAPTRGPDEVVGDARHVLERMVGAVREDAAALQQHLREEDGAVAGTQLLAQIDAAQLALSRIGAMAYPVELDLAPVSAMTLLHDVFDRVDDEVIRRSISTHIQVAPELGPLVVDRGRLRETLSELVRNALDALPGQGGSLELTARPAADGWTAIEVGDDGSGISEEDIAWLYDDGARPADTRGVGLRLATALVEHHGGRLQLQPAASGRGTTARVLLPPAPTRSTRGPRP